MPNPHADVLIATVTTVDSLAVLEVFREPRAARRNRSPSETVSIAARDVSDLVAIHRSGELSVFYERVCCTDPATGNARSAVELSAALIRIG
jgi:hypothetical protein